MRPSREKVTKDPERSLGQTTMDSHLGDQASFPCTAGGTEAGRREMDAAPIIPTYLAPATRGSQFQETHSEPTGRLQNFPHLGIVLIFLIILILS